LSREAIAGSSPDDAGAVLALVTGPIVPAESRRGDRIPRYGFACRLVDVDPYPLVESALTCAGSTAKIGRSDRG
jgi:hypothetical protein